MRRARAVLTLTEMKESLLFMTLKSGHKKTATRAPRIMLVNNA